MRGRYAVFVVVTSVVAGSVGLAQPGRGGSQWLTSLADAQRTSWVRTDEKISVGTLSKPGFEQQWKAKLDNQPRGPHGLGQGVTASGVTLFVPMSLVTGSSNNVYAIDNDIGHVVWQRRFDASLPAATPGCPGGLTAGATRIVSLGPSATAPGAALSFGGRGAVGYRSLLGEPGEGVPVEAPAAGRGRAGGARSPEAAAGAAARGAAPPAPPVPAGRASQPADRIPGAPRREEGGAFGMLFRPSGVVYVVSSDGMLHVLGLASGKDLQRPARFLPANARWSAPVAVGTTLYAATSGQCGGAPSAVWAVDLDSEAKPVVSWKTNGGDVIGEVAFTPDGTLVAAIGPGKTTGDGKANAPDSKIVALDPKTLQLKDWFTQPGAEFTTGPTILRHNGKDIVAAATKDGRILLLDAASLGGTNRATPLHASKPIVGAGATVSGALATWQQPDSTTAATWILAPVEGRLAMARPAANGAVTAGAVVALKLVDAGGALSLTSRWVSHDLTSPATPLIVNGVVFTLATGRRSATSGRDTPAVLHAYDGGTGKRLWTSEKTMATSASPGSLWSGLGQIYVGLHDGTLHAFGFNDERRATAGPSSSAPAKH
jgi:outer membrane protein assembly factor BamB